MAINKNSNGYTFFFAIAMVVVVGVALAVTSESLKPMQKENQAIKKKMDILGAIKIEADRGNANELFDQYVVNRIALDYGGNNVGEMQGDIDPQDKKDPFNIDVKKDFRGTTKGIVKKFKGDPEGLDAALMAEEGINYPLFVCEKDGKTLYVCPMVGTGLWGPIWGYVALEDDYATIYGAKFDHKTETPGLGAEIKEAFFYDKFTGKQLASGQSEVFTVKKGGAVVDEHSVDGITGGTITSKGVGEMLNRTLPVYVKYFGNSNTQRAER